MKIAIITDTHFGGRRGSKVFHDFFQKFYDNIFFPELEKKGIKHCIHMGCLLYTSPSPRDPE